MSYTRVLLLRWSRRDALAVVALAAVVAFLTGGALFYAAAEDRPTDLASEYRPLGDVREFPTVDRARRAAGEEAVVLEFAELESGRLAVAFSPDQRDRASRMGFEIPEPPAEGLGSPHPGHPQSVSVDESDGTRSVTVSRVSEGGFFPDRWYVARPGTVAALGTDGAFLVEPAGDPSSTDVGGDAHVDRPAHARSETVVRSTLVFFERGAEQVRNGFALLIVAAGVLGAVTVTSVVRMTVRDRIETIQVVRATGATPARVLGLFAARGLLLAAAAVAGGYAVGVIVSSVATSVAVYAGLSTTLSPRVTSDAAALLAVTYVPVLAIGLLAGAAAALPAVRRPPAALTNPAGNGGRFGALRRRVGAAVPSFVRPRLLGWRAVVPTAATIAVFAALVFLVLSGGAVAEPLAGESSATVLESGAIHPIASSLPESHAAAFEASGVAASPEILVFGVVDDRPTIVRGARYDNFAAVTGAELRHGRAPEHRGEAMVGSDLARTHDLAVGDTAVVGGGLLGTIERVEVVGRYDAPSAFDDQLLVPLPTARHLSPEGDGSVNFVRLERAPDRDAATGGIEVLAVAVDDPATTPAVGVNVSVVNVADERRNRTISVEFGDHSIAESVTVAARGTADARVSLPVESPGVYRLVAGNRSRNVTVRSPDTLLIRGLPDAVPPGSAPLVRVETVAGRPAANATVTVGSRTEAVGPDGSVRLPFETAGETTVRATAGNRTAERSVTVSENATRRLGTGLRVRPSEVSGLTAPTATVRLSNPWNETATRAITVRGPGETDERTVSVAPGETTAWDVELSRQPRGEYTVALLGNGTRVDGATYRVTGNGGVSTVALRNADVARGGGLGVAIRTVFGNLQVVVASLVALAGLMVAGALVASFARTIHARQRTLGIYRATGAGPERILWLLGRDGLIVGTVSVALGVALGAAGLAALASRDLLVFFGISVAPSFSPGRLALVGGVGLALVLVGVFVPAVAFVRHPPAALFGGNVGTGAAGRPEIRAAGSGRVAGDGQGPAGDRGTAPVGDSETEAAGETGLEAADNEGRGSDTGHSEEESP